MKVEFEKPVIFSTIDSSFTGDGITPIPDNARAYSIVISHRQKMRALARALEIKSLS